MMARVSFVGALVLAANLRADSVSFRESQVCASGCGLRGITRFVSLDSSEIWFTESSAGKIGKLDEASGTVTEYTIPTPDSGPRGIVAAIDGNIWFTEYNAGRIGRITRSGVITEYPTSSSGTHPLEIAAGQEGTSGLPKKALGRWES